MGGGRVSAPVGAWLSQGRGQTGRGSDGEQMPLCVFYVLFYVCNIVTYREISIVITRHNYFQNVTYMLEIFIKIFIKIFLM